jgi:hypothetical protein
MYVRYLQHDVCECIFVIWFYLVDAPHWSLLVRGKEHVVSPELPEVAGKHACPTKRSGRFYSFLNNISGVLSMRIIMTVILGNLLICTIMAPDR